MRHRVNSSFRQTINSHRFRGISMLLKLFYIAAICTSCASPPIQEESTDKETVPPVVIDDLEPPSAGLDATITATPLLESVSLVLDGSTDLQNMNNKVYYRKKGNGNWKNAYPLVADPTDDALAGGIIGLEENTEYEVKVSLLESNTVIQSFQAEFKTWPTDPPINPDKVYSIADIYEGGMLNLEELGISGEPGGWAKIVGDGQTVIDGGYDNYTAIKIGAASYVMFENLKVKGGRLHAIHSLKAHHLRFRNLDVSGWGRTSGAVNDGISYEKPSDEDPINYDSAFWLESTGVVVVERSYVHDPRTGANTWEHGHPSGPNAYLVSTKHSEPDFRGQVVLRYNDFVGGDKHRFNDVVESRSNGSRDGGFIRDSDIYGNYFAFSNDDLVELDGGQHNVRFYGNRLEAGYNGVSIAPNMRGPGFIAGNLIHDLGDERGMAWTAFKAGGLTVKPEGTSYLFHNTVYAKANSLHGTGYSGDRAFNAVTRNNLLVSSAGWSERQYSIRDIAQEPGSDFDFDLLYSTQAAAGVVQAYGGAEANGLTNETPHFRDAPAGKFNLLEESAAINKGTYIANYSDGFLGAAPDIGAFEYGVAKTIPVRPIKITSDAYRVELDAQSPETRTIKLSNSGSDTDFKVLINQHADWIKVSPSSGMISGDGTKDLEISIDSQKMGGSDSRAGAIIIKFDDGYSIPVSVYAD
ncbi:hypothetical protein HCH_04697 [Hahella chejuensis KCTC 2396]|uniref:BACON domain-containing protein n=2 Tax=Hahella chejuensis TaxID=158327 RepID=Q2SD79_HAHCH|nr:hypothetical protein HCH_04697 [Hahella chejuensis KCTC 2396]